MANRQLRVTLIGDATQLNRTLGQTETRLQAFSKAVGTGLGGTGGKFAGPLAQGFAGGAAFAAVNVAATILTESLKSGVVQAASLQKSGEAIDSIFGKAAGSVKAFSLEAAKMGISEEESQKLSVRLGILTRNLGIGAPKAAEMAVGLQKLAGSIAEIRGIDPATVLQNLPQALAGNLRSLKQLGFAFSQAQIKQEAFQEGILKTGEAITPGIKAQAIYALVTRNLAQFEEEAARNSGDLANQQHRLHAQVLNLEASIGQLATGPLTLLVGKLNEAAQVALALTNALKGLGSVKIPGGGFSLGTAFSKQFKFDPLLNPFAIPNIVNAIRGGGGTQPSNAKPSPAFLKAIEDIRRRFGDRAIRNRDFSAAVNTPLIKQLPNRLLGQELDARLSGSTARIKAVLGDEASFLREALKDSRLKTKDRNSLKQSLLSVTSEIGSINQSLKDAADQAKKDAVDAKQEAARTRKAQQEAAKAARAAAAEKLKAAGQNLLSAALDKLQALQSKRQADQQLQDARDQLRVARQIGGPQGIKLARRDVQDALLQQQITRLETANVAGGGRGTFTVTIGQVHLHGIQNPKQLLEALQKLSRTGVSQSRGSRPGRPFGPF